MKPKTRGKIAQRDVYGDRMRAHVNSSSYSVATYIVFYVSSLKCVIYTRQTTIKYLIKRNYLNFINETKHRQNRHGRIYVYMYKYMHVNDGRAIALNVKPSPFYMYHTLRQILLDGTAYM